MPAPFPTRGRPRSDLHDFCRWLKENRGIAPNTVNVYASQVRAILRNTPWITTDTVNAYLATLAPGVRSAHRVAWNHLHAFGRESGLDIPPASAAAVGRSPVVLPEPPDFPLEVRAAIADLARIPELTPGRISKLRWRHVELYPNSDSVYLRLPDDLDLNCVIVPKAPLRVLRTWAWGHARPSPDAAIVPATPEDPDPAPVQIVAQVLVAHSAGSLDPLSQSGDSSTTDLGSSPASTDES